ncbi:hypothetical protein C2869_00450 [Saccharobesus litoralis]|uniref:Solute-binding protein family 3/N-terminal domain-containing protein n=1 Tax=Saccharobesus litoralis TaxID=2172099 RepID=A0A2S0VLC4_9ALTE|nr:hypothetical protein [Saccharobesus litoralis]AWB65001.1 hypothetical protein C2869_00450 [Saccharobesus litoralis]
MKRLFNNLLLATGLMTLSTTVFAQTVITFRAHTLNYDVKSEYPYQALELALRKTQATHGSYKLSLTNDAIPITRVEAETNSDKYENFFFEDSVKSEKLNKFGYVNFPVSLGVVGYRVPFVSQDLKNTNYQINTLDDLKQYSMIMGRGWLDGDILKDNGFTVHTGKNVLGLYHMVANERGDFFPVGAHQVPSIKKNLDAVDHLAVDDNIAVYYPLPRFFFSNKQNTAELARVEQGLKLAFEDGSLQVLWNQHYLQKLKEVNLSNRKIFKLENKYLAGLDPSYKQYIYDPSSAL